jgi:hypothetical protein
MIHRCHHRAMNVYPAPPCIEFGLLGAPCQTPIRTANDLSRALRSSEDDIHRHGFNLMGRSLLSNEDLAEWTEARGWKICQSWQGAYSWKKPTAQGEYCEVGEAGRAELFEELLRRRALAEARSIDATLGITNASPARKKTL